MSMETEVVNAAKLLDKEVPGWHKKVKRNNLKMDMLDSCVLGQIYGNCWNDEIPDKFKNMKAFCLNQGGVNYADDSDKLKQVTELWKQEIRKRRD